MMKTTILVIVVGLLGLGVGYQLGSKTTETEAAVSVEKKESVFDVTWFLDSNNEEEFLRIYRECKTNPGMLEKTPNCINAENARLAALKDNWALAKKLTSIRNSL